MRAEIHECEWTCDACSARVVIKVSDPYRMPDGWCIRERPAYPGGPDPFLVHLCPECIEAER